MTWVVQIIGPRGEDVARYEFTDGRKAQACYDKLVRQFWAFGTRIGLHHD